MFVEEPEVEEHVDAGGAFAEPVGAAGGADDVAGVEGYGIDVVVAREGEGAGVVVFLRDDDDAVGMEDFAGAHDGVEGAEACVVADDAVGRDAQFNEGVFHGLGFVVVFEAVVA